jgi:hypothetical protein
VVSLLSSEIEEALELLSLSPSRGPHSPLSKFRSSSGSDLFDDWPKANDMAVSVYIALTADASSSRASTISARIALKSVSLMAHLLYSLIHELLCLKNLGSGSLRLLVLHRGNLRR